MRKRICLLTCALLSCAPLFSQTELQPVIDQAPGMPKFIQQNPDGPDGFSGNAMNVPYPVIFVHGLGSSAGTWSDLSAFLIQQGWNNGPHLRYNLNFDGDKSTCNIYSASNPDVHSFVGTIWPADYYLISFNVDRQGNEYYSDPDGTQSNQSAIVKQALALKHAIGVVLQSTGKDKVVLFGHSMGGLAIRAYLQNPNFWQADGKHHVAKVITSGTPHQGSDVTGFGIGWLADVSGRSEAKSSMI